MTQPAEDLTDLGNAIRLVRHYGDRLRYCFPWSRWLVYRDGHWAADDLGLVMQMAKRTVGLIYNEAAVAASGAQQIALGNHAKKTQSADRLRAMVDLARSEPGVPVLPAALDGQHDLVNFSNGTLDLTTGILRAHDPADLITVLLPYAHNPVACCPTWDAFLARVFNGKADMIAFIQRAVGYSLTGRQDEQCFFFLYGTGANGKSVFLHVLRALFGNAAKSATFSTFLKQRDTGRPRPDLARLAGARLVTSAEAGNGQQFDEELLKAITGGEPITARKLYADDFEFTPQCTLWLAANHRPGIVGSDVAIWRRVCLIPFEVTIPEEERIKFEAYCALLERELPGIFNWALEGYREWQKRGIQKPGAVILATEEYRQDSDILGEFLDHHCDIGSQCRSSAGEIYAAYKEYCAGSGEQLSTQKWLGGRLKERGFHSVKSHGVTIYHGLTPLNGGGLTRSGENGYRGNGRNKLAEPDQSSPWSPDVPLGDEPRQA